MATDNVRDILQDLVHICRDGQNGYRDAAEHITSSELKSFFNEQSLDRARCAATLEAELQRLGEADPNRKGTMAGALHRAWFDMKANLGGGDQTILDSVEQGEDAAKKAYEKALEADLPENVAGIVRTQAQSIFAAHDRVKLLRDRQKAA